MRIFCTIVTAVLLLLIACSVQSPAVAEVVPLDPDLLTFGRKPLAAGFTKESYEDDSISVHVSRQKLLSLWTTVVTVKIADPSQIRTAMSNDSYESRGYTGAAVMAKHVNAVVAVDGDFFKYDYDVGYEVRQGQLYRNKPNGKRDVLLIDSEGDFHAVKNATSESIADFIASSLPAERSVANTFSFGPLLVKDGKAQTISISEFQSTVKMQRVAIVQLGTLEYAIVECDGSGDGSKGMTLSSFAEYISELFPECRLAYNLDGGGSANIIFNGKRIHPNYDARKICDILYFASAHED